MAFLQREDLCEVPRVLSVATIRRSPEYSSPIQRHFCHSMSDPDLLASTATTVPSSSVYSTSDIQSRSETYNCHPDYFEAEASKDFWSEFEFSGLAMNQGGVDCHPDYFEAEASKDFWSEFEFSGLAMNQRGVDQINKEVEGNQIRRPVLASRKRHKGLLGGVTEFDPTA